jgi:hypothetical protein
MFHGGVQAYEFDEYTLELDKYIKPWRNEISEFSWAFCSAGGDGKKPVHLVPITIQGMGIYYNKALFSTFVGSGVPESVPSAATFSQAGPLTFP